MRPLQAKVKEMGLWACHLTPDPGGQGYGQIKLALLNEKLGRVGLAPVVFGCQAPDTGNAEIISHYGTPEQKNYYLPRLAKGLELPCFALTAPDAGSDAASMPDVGIVCTQMWEGRETLGVRGTWEKRYHTVAPVAPVPLWRGRSGRRSGRS